VHCDWLKHKKTASVEKPVVRYRRPKRVLQQAARLKQNPENDYSMAVDCDNKSGT